MPSEEVPETSREPAPTVDDLLDGATRLGSFTPRDARSSAPFERVLIEGRVHVVKYVHPDHDFAIRALGDISCIPLLAWTSGVMDSVPEFIDHATVGAAPWGRNGWGCALLMRDVTHELVPVSDAPIDRSWHDGFLDGLTALSAHHWGPTDGAGLLPPAARWHMFAPAVLEMERRSGCEETVPRIASKGWEEFSRRAPSDVVAAIAAVHHDAYGFEAELATTPYTLLHGDWKFGNLGRSADDRTVLIDWTYVGAGPVAADLAWYLALNRARLPVGVSKDDVLDHFPSLLDQRGIDPAGWWERQRDLCLLGMLALFGWEKALGPDEELAWWCDRARRGMERL